MSRCSYMVTMPRPWIVPAKVCTPSDFCLLLLNANELLCLFDELNGVELRFF